MTSHFFVDPSMEEEEMSHTVLRIAVNPDAKEDEDSIYLFEVSGQTEIDPILIEKCHKIAMTRSQLIKQLMLDTWKQTSFAFFLKCIQIKRIHLFW